MDRNTVIGFILIGLVLMLWMYLNAPPPQQPGAVPQRDSLAALQQAPPRADTTAARPPTPPAQPEDTLGKYFGPLAKGKEKIITVETDLYRAEISSLGGALHSWEPTGFRTWDQYPVNLINKEKGSEFHLSFFSSDGKIVSTKGLYFDMNYPDGQVLKLKGNDSLVLEMSLKVSEKSRIVKTFVFYGSSYSFDALYRFERMQNIISNFEYRLSWESGLRYLEHNSIDESNYAKAYAYAGGELAEIDATSFTEPARDNNISGRVRWVATRNKYFAVAIIPREKESKGAYLEGRRLHMPDEGAKENYSIELTMPYTGSETESDRYTVFLGPLDFDIVKRYNVDLDKIMSLGAAWIIRPISEYVIIPLLNVLRYVIPNYGFVLIVFSIIIKLALYPLTKTSMRSMQKMQALQPMMEEIRAKYKDDPQKMNQQVMRLYKEYGINPAGGCLPLLLQLPILYALWAVFSSAIQLRQASFIWWIHDLSVPDVITTLPFKLPIFNIDKVSGLALMMGVTMFVQQKMSVKDPRQKMMVWMMPVLLTLMFNGFPSGLNLYYFMFNLLSIGQQAYLNKKHKGEPLRKVEEKKRKGGIISKLAKDLSQGKR